MIKILTERVNNRSEEYYEYLDQHISGVKKAFNEIKENLDLNEYELEELEYQIEQHDKSKYEDEEFYPYLYHFYPSEAGKDTKEFYDAAWNHHQKSNKHHWQYWIIIKDGGEQYPLDMPLHYIIEMLCDWSSFKYKNPESTANKWYDDNKDKMILSDNTRKTVEELLNKFTNL